jgi:hypothetical protein
VRSRNGISYLTARRFSAQDRPGAIRAIKVLKAEAGARESALAAAEIVLLWLRLTGNPGAWTVTNIAGGHRGGNSFGARLAVAVAERLSLGYLQVWRDWPIKGVSRPKEFRRLPPLDMRARPIGATHVIDDVATSGWHMEEALTALRARHSGRGHRLDFGGQRRGNGAAAGLAGWAGGLARWTTRLKSAGWRTSDRSSLGNRAIPADTARLRSMSATRAQIHVGVGPRLYRDRPPRR